MIQKFRKRYLYFRPSAIRLMSWSVVVILSSFLVFMYVWMASYYDHQIRQPNLYLTISDASHLNTREILMAMTDPDALNSRSVFELGDSQVEVNDFDMSSDAPTKLKLNVEKTQTQLWPDILAQAKLDKEKLGRQQTNLLSETLSNPSENEQTSPMVFLEPAIITAATKNVDSLETTTDASVKHTQIDEIFQVRLDRMNSYCSKQLEGSMKGKKTMWIHYKYNKPLKNSSRKKMNVQWCPIYKSASSPWMAVFMKLKDVLSPKIEQLIRSGKTTFVRLARTFRLNVDHPFKYKSEKERERQNKEFNISMIVVRHPFERILSAYRDKLERLHGRSYYNKKYGIPIIRKFRPKNEWRESIIIPLMTLRMKSMTDRDNSGKGGRWTTGSKKHYYDQFETTTSHTPNPNRHIIPTFNEFVQYLLSNKGWPMNMDEHWRPFYVDCNPCWGTKFNLILKVETMNRDRDYFFNLIGISKRNNTKDDDDDDDDYTQLDQAWKRWTNSVKWNESTSTSNHLNKSQIYFSQVSKEDIKRLYLLYEPDFNMFGYSPNEYIKMGT